MIRFHSALSPYLFITSAVEHTALCGFTHARCQRMEGFCSCFGLQRGCQSTACNPHQGLARVELVLCLSRRYWMYAVVAAGPQGVLLSNDEMRDHIFQLLAPKFFYKWKQVTSYYPLSQSIQPYSTFTCSDAIWDSCAPCKESVTDAASVFSFASNL